MNEAIANGATHAVQAAAYTAVRPRVSAASFKDLTARLRKTDIPTISPVVVAPQPIAPAPIEPIVVIPPVETPVVAVTPTVVETAFAPPPVVETVVVQTAAEATLAPVWHEPPPVEIVPTPIDIITPQPLPEVETPSLAAEPIETEAGLVAKQDDANEALRELARSRQHQLELETIWRMLLATPNAEDRNVYLREAVEIMGAAAVLPMPETAPEYDLSTIAPASDADGVAVEVDAEADTDQPSPVLDFEDDSNSITSNADLARSLLDMMASGASSGLPHERALAADTLLRLVPRLDLKSLVMLSQRVARMDAPPPMLVARLLRDPRVEVSGPLLEDCSQITDKDLESVIAERDMARLRIIARRRSLGHATTDALIASEDASVHLTLVRNKEAEISQDGFLHLIASAGANIDLLAPLCTRADMPAPMAFELFWHAPAQLRRFILSRFLTDSETLTKILRITMSTNELDQLESQEGSLQHTIVEALERAARGKLDAAAEELGGALKVDPKTILRVLKDAQGEPLVVMLKVAGYPRQAVAGLLSRYRDVEIGLIEAERDLEDLVSIFETLSFNKARILLTYWDWAQRRTGPYAPLH